MSTALEAQPVTVNGERREVPAGTTLPDLLRSIHVDPEHAKGVAVAVNDEVVRRGGWGEVVLQAGDRVEVITAKQGG